MTTPEKVQDFIRRWGATKLNEKAIAHSHFKELCEIIGFPAPYESEAIPADDYRFEKPLTKSGGGAGFADVWYRGRFVWEYKTPGRSLESAYQQLLLYKESLENPPILVVCDIKRYEVHIAYTGYRTRVETFTNADLQNKGFRDLLLQVFSDPASLRPEERAETVTERAAERFAELAISLEGRGYTPDDVAPFFMRLLFALFAEDIRIMPNEVMTDYIFNAIDEPETFPARLTALFKIMREGGYFGSGERYPQVDGWLYADDHIIPLNENELRILSEAALLNWKDIEPSIFGTLFERCIDPAKRSQLGLHYTGRDDILLIVEPVVMAPLRREWQAVQQEVDQHRAEWDDILHQLDLEFQRVQSQYDTTGSFFHIADADKLNDVTLRRKHQRLQHHLEGILYRFMDRLAEVRVLDPACGSGNFLYVALHQLKDLEKEVAVYAKGLGVTEPVLGVTPAQFFGIEKNPFAAELAQVVIWIGYLQWRRINGYWDLREPVLQSLQTIQCKDAIQERDEQGHLREPEWPEADFVIGNPPFLGTKKMRFEYGDAETDLLQSLYHERVPSDADLVTYWFERARAYIEQGRVKRAGFLATQGIRGGANRMVLRRIKETGDIFMAWSDRDWVLEGATVHVSMVGFDDGSDESHVLNGERVSTINANLTSGVDLTVARVLPENANLSFMGDTKQGAFDIDEKTARRMLNAKNNPHGKPNSDVVRPWVNGRDIARAPRGRWIIDFGLDMPEAEAKQYRQPFSYVRKYVKPQREKRVRDWYREQWWLHYAPRPLMREALAPLERFIVTPRVAKYRLFVWLRHPTLPDCQLIVFARDDDYFFGMLHSWPHELWARRMGTQLRDAKSGARYTPTTTFETFPLPWPPGSEPPGDPQVQAIARAASNLVEQREAWLNPPDTEDLPASERKKRTLTNLYNLRPDWLSQAHRTLDEAVLQAYGWPTDIDDEDLLERLLALNHERAAGAGEPVLAAEARASQEEAFIEEENGNGDENGNGSSE